MSRALKPEVISLFKKQRFLLQMSEAQFRDGVLRPLFLRQGLKDGRDLCGPSEQGKDALFVSTDELGMENVYVVQTKKGNINLASKAQANLLEAVAQLRTAAETKIPFIKTKTKKLPAKVILCVSGRINQAAKDHICQEIPDPRLSFFDCDELIPKIDELFPELWLGIDSDIAPYFRKIKEVIENSDETLAMAELLPRDSQAGVATDQGFVTLQLYRMAIKLEKQHGQVTKVPHFEQMPVTSLLKKRRNRRLFAIFGGAGSGKSTSLKRLAYVLATRGLKFESSDKPFIPILLRAIDVSGNSDRSIVELCDAECRRLTGLKRASFSTQDLAAGKVFVLIDALDELPDDNSRIAVISLIQDFHQMYPDCTVVLTSRDHNSVKSLAVLRNFDKYNISPINYKQAEQIIKTVQKGKNIPIEKSQELVRRLEEVHGMELNPLLVTVFAAKRSNAPHKSPPPTLPLPFPLVALFAAPPKPNSPSATLPSPASTVTAANAKSAAALMPCRSNSFISNGRMSPASAAFSSSPTQTPSTVTPAPLALTSSAARTSASSSNSSSSNGAPSKSAPPLCFAPFALSLASTKKAAGPTSPKLTSSCVAMIPALLHPASRNRLRIALPKPPQQHMTDTLLLPPQGFMRNTPHRPYPPSAPSSFIKTTAPLRELVQFLARTRAFLKINRMPLSSPPPSNASPVLNAPAMNALLPQRARFVPALRKLVHLPRTPAFLKIKQVLPSSPPPSNASPNIGAPAPPLRGIMRKTALRPYPPSVASPNKQMRQRILIEFLWEIRTCHNPLKTKGRRHS